MALPVPELPAKTRPLLALCKLSGGEIHDLSFVDVF
jgi:hypothetical protein